jgi:aldehyde:ferredoxin oxidoreductase
MVLRENRQRKDDNIGQAWFERLIGGSESLSQPLDRNQWEALIDRYYSLRGWNISNGRPTREKLEELGIREVADTLQSAGRLG